MTETAFGGLLQGCADGEGSVSQPICTVVPDTFCVSPRLSNPYGPLGSWDGITAG